MAYTEFYLQAGGSNVNAGSTTSNSAAYSATNGGWNSGTGVFTPTSGDPSATVSVGNFASVYTDGATVTGFVGRVTAVSSTTITISVIAKSGTVPTTAGTGISCKVGGAWAGPSGASGFPFGTVAGTMTNSTGNPPRVNFLAATYSITAAVTHAANGPTVFQGYTTAPGDGGRATIDGGTSGASYVLLTVSGTNVVLRDLIFSNNGATGSANGTAVSGANCLAERVTFTAFRGSGCRSTGGGNVFRECEACGCNQSNTALLAGIDLSGTANVIRRSALHHNTGSNNNGLVLDGGSNTITVVEDCVFGANGLHGLFCQVRNGATISQCDSYGNGGDGFRVDNSGFVQLVTVENCNAVNNTGYGYNSQQSNFVILRNCGSYNNTSGRSNAQLATQDEGAVTYTASPYTDATNGDFRLNGTASAGAFARGAGRGAFTIATSSYSSGASTLGYLDIGAAQHADAGGGLLMQRGFTGGFPG